MISMGKRPRFTATTEEVLTVNKMAFSFSWFAALFWRFVGVVQIQSFQEHH